MPRDAKEIGAGLQKKGFVPRENDHTFYHLIVNGKKTVISTKISHGDSSIVVNAVNRKGLKDHKRHPNIQPLIARVREQVKHFQYFAISWNPREENTTADSLSTGRFIQ